MKHSIIVPVLNQLHYTKQCLIDLNATLSPEDEIIIIDNGSTDGTGEFLKKRGGISVLVNSINKGCAHAWNQGINKCSGDWITILNNDVRLPRRWAENLFASAIEKKIDVISPGMREGNLNYDFDLYSQDYMVDMQFAFRHWTPSGVCFSVRSNVFDKVGLFDEKFEVGQYEDADFFRRCKNSNIKMGITGKSFIHHYGSVTQKSISSTFTIDYSKRNRNYHRKKWGIGFFRRHFERYREQLLINYWSRKEYSLYGHSLLEKHDGQKLNYY